MIDLEKLREIAETVETEFFTINADEVLELLDHIAALEKDAGRYRTMKLTARTGSIGFGNDWISAEDMQSEMDEFMDSMESKHG